ncbi:MAG: hypothetical protein MJ239_01895 [Bacilli bacterium]|nr:hypothetical protein [Bacilli bacterium]
MKRKYSVKDFKASSLPGSRKEQLRDVLSVNFPIILLNGLISIVGFLPTYLLFILENNVLRDISITDDFGNYFIWSSIFGGFRVITICFLFLVIAGLANIYRVLCYEEGLFYRQDFFAGIKENWKHYLLTGFIIGVFLLALEALQTLSGSKSGSLALEIAYYGYFGIFIVFILTIAQVLLFMSNIYACSYGRHIANSSIISLKYLFPLVLFSIFLGVSYLILWIPLFIIQVIALALYLLFLFPIFLLMFHLYCLYIVDVNINKDYPELLNKGLYKGE